MVQVDLSWGEIGSSSARLPTFVEIHSGLPLWRTAIVHYRLYFMDIVSGRIEDARDVEALDDQEAVKIASSLSTEQPIEIWCGAREVHRVGTALQGVMNSDRPGDRNRS
jgi:hypothetical protein